jgi:threonine/homoserine/homoserine lactone efflux protein
VGFIPDWTTLAAYSMACAILFITPGPDMSFFLARTLAGGRSEGIAAFLGASTGSLVHTVLAAVGLSALLAASASAFFLLKVVGATYLLWLAIDAIRNGSTLRMAPTGSRKASFWTTYSMGIGINLTNPKIVLFFVTFLPQFVHATDVDAPGKLLFLGLYFILFCLPLGIGMVLIAGRFVAALKTYPRIMRAIDWVFASVLCLFAIKILAVERA